MSVAAPGPPPLRRALLVWGVAEVAYAFAVAARTSLGVAGVEAMERFSLSASALALFSSLQVGVYGFAQIPVGLALDRWGPRRLLVWGGVLVALAQTGMALSSDLPSALLWRVALGIGDATAFVSVLRLLPEWFAPARIPLLTQLTSILGMTGQLASAVPFMGVLHHRGWTVAFVGMGVATLVAAGAVLVVVRDRPARVPAGGDEGGPVRAASAHEGVSTTLAHVLRTPWTWLGFFTHWSGAGPSMTFSLLWGVPFMTLGAGMSKAQASAVLVWLTLVNVAVGPVAGQLTAHHPRGRVPGVVLSAVATALGWVLVLAPSQPGPRWTMWLLGALLAVSGVSSSIGFDFVRQGVPSHRLGTAIGATNMGGFTATLLAVQGIGWVLDHLPGAPAQGWADYRVALAFQALTWVVGMVGVAVCARLVTLRGGWARPRP